MQQLATRRYESDDAREYADLLSTCNDLGFVLAATERLLTELKKPDDQQDGVTVRAFWSAATIAYMRCFGSGKRQGLQTGIFDTLPHAGPVHQHIKDTSDKHVAHSVNAFELGRTLLESGLFAGGDRNRTDESRFCRYWSAILTEQHRRPKQHKECGCRHLLSLHVLPCMQVFTT